MNIRFKNQFKIIAWCIAGILAMTASCAYADTDISPAELTNDRIAVVTQQISLLKNRYEQVEHQLTNLVRDDKPLSSGAVEQAGKNLLDKASLDLSIAKSDLESINIELGDARQTVSSLDKNIQEIENQLDILKVFGNRITNNGMMSVEQLHTDLAYQQKLVALEKERVNFLVNLYKDATTILQLRKDQIAKLSAQFKSQRLINLKQQEVGDELAYQLQQNEGMQRVRALYAKLAKVKPTDKAQYSHIEDEIFITNENANYAYTQSLIARYRDQINQLKLVVIKSSSISQLNELSTQVQLLDKQIERLNKVLASRITLLNEHASTPNLVSVQKKYQESSTALQALSDRLDKFRLSLDKAMQTELSSRQGLPSFNLKTAVDIGKEMLLVPALTFQVVKSLTVILIQNIKSANVWVWGLFVFVQSLLAFAFMLASKLTNYLLRRPSGWREKINSKWLSLKWLDHHFTDLYLMSTVISTMFIFSVPLSNFIFFVYVAGVWFGFKSIIVIARTCLVETTDHSSGKDMRLYKRLKSIFVIGGVLTAAAVFIYQLPLLYELKSLSDRLFLMFMMIVSLILLRFWDVVPTLIITHMEVRNSYYEKSICVLGVLVPLLLFANSVIGLTGYVNLVMTVSL